MATYSAPVLSENNHKVYIDITETTNVASNTSSISWKVYYKVEGNGSYFHYNNGNSLIVKLNGTEYYNGNPGAINVDYPNSKDLTSGNFTFSHNSDGSGSFSVYVYFKQSQKTNCTATINTTFTCTPIKRRYTVTYHGNGGKYDGSETWVDPTLATYNESYTTHSNNNFFVKDGYTFIGWNESADGTGSDWTDWIGKPWPWTYTKNVILYAQWVKNEYDIIFNGNGGLVDNSETITHEKKYNTNFSLSTIVPSRYGYDFKYWTTTPEDTAAGALFTSIDNPEKIPRVWIEKSENGTTGWEILVYAPSSASFCVPTWTSLNGQDDIDWNPAQAGDWSKDYKKKSYTFNFRKLIYRQDHNLESINYLSHFYGYDSTGTNIVKDGKILPTYSVEFYSTDSFSYDQDVTFYAQWEAKKYRLTLNLNGGKINRNPNPVTIGDVLTFNESFLTSLGSYIPVRPFYEFEGFYDSEGFKAYDVDGLAVEGKYWDSTKKYIHDGDMILYAHWKPLNLAHYNLNGKWVLCNSYVKDNGVWEPAIINLKTEQDWITIV